MVSSELGACEWFVWDLRRSNLLDRGQLDQIVGEFLQKNPRADPPALAEYLVGMGILTEFQSERLLQGKTQGFVLGPFTLMDALGTGSMGTVYKAQSKTDNNWYAVKVLPRRSMWNVRLARRKVRAFEQCRHPSVVPFVDVGTSGGMHYLAWPLVEGEPLDKRMTRGKLPHGLAAHYAMQIAEGLDVCHRQGLIHGLMKPSNIMVAANQDQIHILDFGIGCLLAETEGESLVDTMSTANAVASGLDCASPESIMEPTNLTPAGDQYSLGCTLYYMLTGQYPFPDGTAAEKMMAHQFKQPKAIEELCPEVPAGLVEIVNRLLQKAPEQRFASTGDVVEALRNFANKGLPARRDSAIRPGMPGSGVQPASPNVSSRTPAPTVAPRVSGLSSVPPAAAAPKQPSTPLPRVNPGSGLGPRPATMLAGGPRPATMSALPTRETVRASTSVPSAPPPVSPPEITAQPHDEVNEGAAQPVSQWDQKLGPVASAGVTALICCAAFAAARYFQIL